MMRYEHFYVHTYIIYRDIYKYQVDIYLKQHYHAHLHTYIHKLKVLNAERSSSWVKMVLICKVESLELLGHCCLHVISIQNHS